MNPTQIQNILVLLLIFGFATMEIVSRLYHRKVNATSEDTKLELLMFLSLLAITQPLAILVTSKLGNTFFPDAKGAIADWPWWAMVGVLLVLDDLSQYWWHRLSHSTFM